jgi:hypothetical protein
MTRSDTGLPARDVSSVNLPANPQPHVIIFDGAVTDENGIAERTLSNEMALSSREVKSTES